MDRTFNSSCLIFGSVQFGADLELSSRAEMNQLAQDATVQELRDALYSATQEIRSLKADNKWLKEKIAVLEDDQRQEVSQLQEELKKKDELQERVTKKLRARTKAHVESLYLLTQKEEELKSTCDALKVSFKDRMAHKEKIWKRKLQEVQKKESSRQQKPFEKVQKSRPKKSQNAEDTERIISENNQPQKRAYKQKLKKNRKRAKREKIRMEEMKKDVMMMTTWRRGQK